MTESKETVVGGECKLCSDVSLEELISRLVLFCDTKYKILFNPEGCSHGYPCIFALSFHFVQSG